MNFGMGAMKKALRFRDTNCFSSHFMLVVIWVVSCAEIGKESPTGPANKHPDGHMKVRILDYFIFTVGFTDSVKPFYIILLPGTYHVFAFNWMGKKYTVDGTLSEDFLFAFF